MPCGRRRVCVCSNPSTLNNPDASIINLAIVSLTPLLPPPANIHVLINLYRTLGKLTASDPSSSISDRWNF